jgi:hypothetical protein
MMRGAGGDCNSGATAEAATAARHGRCLRVDECTAGAGAEANHEKEKRMPRNKGTTRTEAGMRGHKGSSKKTKEQQEQQARDRHDEENKRRFTDQSGLAAQELPEAAHGQNVVDPPEEMTRNLPQQHGGEVVTDPHAEGGLRGARESSDADIHGHRKRN